MPQVWEVINKINVISLALIVM